MEKVFDVIETGLNFPEPDKEILQAVERYKTLNNILKVMIPNTPKNIYNPNLDYIQLMDCFYT